MKFINKMERKFGKYALQNLPAIMIGLYAAGYLLTFIAPDILEYLTLEPGYILQGQVWRILTWVIVPPSTPSIFTIIMLLFYFSLGKTLERTWGAFRFNLYIFSGIFFTVIGAMLLYAYYFATLGMRFRFGGLFTTYYINLSIFLAFAVSYPDMQVLLYFFIPIKMKWMSVVYGVLIAYEFIMGNPGTRVVIVVSLLNFFLFFLLTRNTYRFNPKEIRRRANFRKAMQSGRNHAPGAGSRAGAGRNGAGTFAGRSASAQPIHRCAVCGRTEQDNPNLTFRYCSKCDGAYEYCQDHLFTHDHVHVNPQDNKS